MTFDELVRHVNRLHKQLEAENKARLEQNQRIERQASSARARARAQAHRR